jgi:hypothetical protein
MMEGALIDKLVAASAAMPAAVYFLGSLVAWYRVFSPMTGKPSYVDRLMLSRAVAWSALCLLFFFIASMKLRAVTMGDRMADVILTALNLTVLGSALMSIKAITTSFGYRFLFFFVACATFSGLAVLFFGTGEFAI